MAITGPRNVKAALKTLLEADATMSGVTIYTYTVDTDSLTTREWLVLGNVKGDVEHNTMGGSNLLAEYDIECAFTIHQPAANDSQDRAWAILDAVNGVIGPNWTVSGNVLDATLTAFTVDETVHANSGRRVDVEFTIKVRDLNA